MVCFCAGPEIQVWLQTLPASHLSPWLSLMISKSSTFKGNGKVCATHVSVCERTLPSCARCLSDRAALWSVTEALAQACTGARFHITLGVRRCVCVYMSASALFFCLACSSASSLISVGHYEAVCALAKCSPCQVSCKCVYSWPTTSLCNTALVSAITCNPCSLISAPVHYNIKLFLWTLTP